MNKSYPYFLWALILLISSSAIAQTKLLRFPDIHGSEVVFCYAGDIWKAPVDGGTAIRLTAHPGQELFPKFSPDGKSIAFTGQYDGDEQVYIIPSEGGTPKQLTYYPAVGPLPPRWGYDHMVYGWTPDGDKVLFRSLRNANGGSNEGALFTVSKDGGLPMQLPMPTSGVGDFSADGKKMVYSPLFRDFRTWKRYEGGWAQNLYIVDLANLETSKVSHSKRTERDPMWIGNSIYFCSDRDGTLNLYKYEPNGDKTTKLTTSTDWDVRWPSSDNKGKIVYEYGGELSVFDVASGKSTAISINVPDDGLAMRPSKYSASKNIEGYGLAPKGQRVLFVARGDIFTAPIEKGSVRNLTNSSDAHDRGADWSPDGKNIVYISDKTGEDQLYLIDQLGKSDPVQLTTDFKGQLGGIRYSPDSKRIAFTQNNEGKLFVLNVANKSYKEVGNDEFGGIGDHMWSNDGMFLAFSMSDWSGFSSIYIYSVSDGQTRRITDGRFTESEPVFDPEGNYLYFLSDRSYAPQFSSWEWNYATNRMTGVYAMALRKDVGHPFPPESDEVSMEEEKKEDEGDKGKSKKKGAETSESGLKIDWDGLSKRVTRFPIDFENISGLMANKGHIFYTTYGQGFYGRGSYEKTKLHAFSMKDRESSVIYDDMGGYNVSPDGSKIMVSSRGKYVMIDAKPKGGEKKTIKTSGMMVDRVPAEEWETIFWEVWRRYRDYFYVRNMHGYDWEAIGKQYAGLLEHVAHRSDLNYVISEMIAELNVGHAYIQGGDYEIPSRPRVALAGAQFELDEASGKYRISKIFQGNNEEPKYRAPLTEVGIDAKVGDYVLAIDGEPLDGGDNPYRLLQHKRDAVTLTLSSSSSGSGREVQYDPVSSESKLLYLEWTERNRKMVDEMSNGRVGYMHIPNMGADGIYEFIKAFYPQIRKEGMIVDVRSNGGGNISQWIIERLDTRMLGTRFGYSSEKPITYPYTVFHGHKVCLINQTSASDGDIFPHYFREAGLGPLIGKRTWGGVVGISGRGPLLDGGSTFVPLRATNNTKGDYIIEGSGVTPDIEVENDPASVIAGKDNQLERGVQEALKKIESDPMTWPEKPADPVKTN